MKLIMTGKPVGAVSCAAPVVVAHYQGARYLVSMLGEAQTGRATAGCAVLR